MREGGCRAGYFGIRPENLERAGGAVSAVTQDSTTEVRFQHHFGGGRGGRREREETEKEVCVCVCVCLTLVRASECAGQKAYKESLP